MTGAQALISALQAAGVRKIFALSGNQIMPIFDASIGSGISIIHTRHEAAAVYMAEAYSQITGEIGVALVTAGVGAANAVGPLIPSRLSESPVLLLSGDSPVSQDGMGAFQALDQVAMTKPITKLSMRPVAAWEVAPAVTYAIQLAQSGRKGPVHIALPADVLQAQVSDANVSPTHSPPYSKPIDALPQRHQVDAPQVNTASPDAGALHAVHKQISQAKKPLIICGPSLNKSREPELMHRLGATLHLPVVAMESPRALRDPVLGNIAEVIAQADLIVTLGKIIDYTLTFGRAQITKAQWIVIDPEADELDRAHQHLGERLSAKLEMNASVAAKGLIESGEPPLGEAASTAREAWCHTAQSMISARSYSIETPASDALITSAVLASQVKQFIKNTAKSVVVCEGGEFGQWAQAEIQADHRIICGIAGAIGGGIGYGIGAKTAHPDATVFVMTGDGSMGFHFGEFETAVRENIPFVVIIGNDMCWNAEHQLQLREYGPDRLIGCHLSTARYDLAAAALGAHGEWVTKFSQLEPAITRAVASNKVACVNVEITGLPAPSGSAH